MVFLSSCFAVYAWGSTNILSGLAQGIPFFTQLSASIACK
jgi:hypothetical protein